MMYEVLDESLRRAEMNHNITYGTLNRSCIHDYYVFTQLFLVLTCFLVKIFCFPAILFECVKTIYTIHPKAELLEKGAKCISNFVLSPKINLKYLGKVWIHLLLIYKYDKRIFIVYSSTYIFIVVRRTLFMLLTCVALEGLKALTYVVQQDANLALQHQMTIIECLDHSDLIIKREVGGQHSVDRYCDRLVHLLFLI